MARGSEILGAFLYDLPKDQLPVPTDIEEVRRRNPDKLVVPIFADLEKARRETKPATVKKIQQFLVTWLIKLKKPELIFLRL